ncbi:hypothetical protein [Streptomyces sp. V3I7]|uniref:hypothetical protein n=1 Tax=Streptomyces sp. V3I7 TaxID=3042278 RepID=UPI00277FC6DF|nr:hypothetical protein [Streptomyces sp. V3I7]MDQ0992718.1 hypothetical protein [Streptomyces sp. V3I7]
MKHISEGRAASGRADVVAAPGARRGRHRRPRPRRALLAAGGLALAAGALSLVRSAPESGVGGPGPAEAEPRLNERGGVTELPANAAATVGAARPSATSVMGGASAPVPTTTGTTAPAATATSLPAFLPGGAERVPTTIPTAVVRTPGAPATTGAAPRPSATSSARPSTPPPATAPSHSTPAPAPRPASPGTVCVPVIGLCVGPLRLPAVQER